MVISTDAIIISLGLFEMKTLANPNFYLLCWKPNCLAIINIEFNYYTINSMSTDLKEIIQFHFYYLIATSGEAFA